MRSQKRNMAARRSREASAPGFAVLRDDRIDRERGLFFRSAFG